MIEPLPTIWPFITIPEMPEGNEGALHLLLTLHSSLTLLCLFSGPMMIWRACRDRADALYWIPAALP